MEDSIKCKKRETPLVPAKIDGSVETHIIAVAFSDPPAGWKMDSQTYC
ncbi:MAG: hypothetical protein ACOXZ4_07860 [Sphaerochaetaceae bacterium]